MKIKKILNNSVVLSLDANDKEIIVMGSGIAYAKKIGDDIDPKQITKKFVVSSMEYPQKILDLFSDVPLECIELTDNIIQYAKQKISLELHETVYISIIDHIRASIERYKEGITLNNKLLWEIKNFYKEEFEIGLYGLKLIEETYHIKMQEDEAGFIALHIVSARTNDDIHQTYEVTNFIQNITNIVKYHFNIEYDLESLSYYRFVTHLKFFAIRLFSQSESNNNLLKNELLDMIKEKYVRPYLCSLKIKQYIEEKYQYHLDNDEILYLSIHIAKITEGK
ncbi:BglG family transcription antiterminator LicT [Zophobihabitans entericus]|uniref:PRD domain-containing protein n=1 Tax=Zophobihabitans entericus TaxID=1635327 RepID=A0A6G9ICU9_9GAMM|nr:PRD domain-containing protein [Zophobihabitans entericus]QIQ21667.1 PRD domain-containing protein [Zophobihabitans entericus]